MMVSRRGLRASFLLCVCAVGAGASAAPLSGRLAALAVLEPGLWRLRADGEPQRELCLTDPVVLTQLRHRGRACARLVIADERDSATVHYSCAGAGWGRTTVRVETPRLARVDTQGIADQAPFAFVAEARRIGSCTEPGRE